MQPPELFILFSTPTVQCNFNFCNSLVNECLFLSPLTEEQYKVETRTIAVDFGKTDIYSKIEAGLTGLEIGVLGKTCFPKRHWQDSVHLFFFCPVMTFTCRRL